MNSTISTISGVDTAFLYIIGFSLIFLTLVTIVMIYFVIRYRASKHPVPADIRDNVKLEIAWMVIPTLIALSMFYFGWQSFLGLRNVPPNALDINVTAEMFTWNFTYPNGKTTQDYLVVPSGKPVKLNLTSKDVIHSLAIPAFRIKRDAIKDMDTYAWFMADKPGTHKILCTEFCGAGHSEMIADLRIVPPAEYEAFLVKKEEKIEPEASQARSAADYNLPPETEFFHIIDKMEFYWKVEKDKIHVKLRAKTPGWLGIGFNPEKRMKGANFVLGAVSDGKVLITDDYGTGYSKHKQDASLGGAQNVTNIYGSEENETTEIGFTLDLNTGDTKDPAIHPEQKTIVLLAFSGGQDSFMSRHSYRAAFAVNLLTGKFKKASK